MSQTGCFVGCSFLFNVELSIFLLCNTPQWFIPCFFFFFLVSSFTSPSQGYTRVGILISAWCLQLVCSHIRVYQEPIPSSCRRRAVIITPSPVLRRCSLLCWSHQREPSPPLPSPPLSYAARPIISPSLGIDQRAGESQLWGRERAALITSARSTQRLSTRKDDDDGERCGEEEEASHVGDSICTICMQGRRLLPHGNVAVTHKTLQSIQSWVEGWGFFIIQKKKNLCTSVGPKTFVKVARHLNFLHYLFLQ